MKKKFHNLLLLTTELHCTAENISSFKNDPKFSNKKVEANSADQTAPRGSSLFAVPFAFV